MSLLFAILLIAYLALCSLAIAVLRFCLHLTSLLFIHYMAMHQLDLSFLNILKYYSIAV